MNPLTLHPLLSPINAEVAIPGSKSYTNRALLLSAFCDAPVTIHNALICDDTKTMADCLRALGISVKIQQTNITVSGSLNKISNTTYDLNARMSGTTMRFLLAALCILPGTKILRGEGRMHDRPIADLIEALCSVGANISYMEKVGYPPVKILSNSLKPGIIRIHGGISSQFVSALLMLAPLAGLNVEILGEQRSRPYIDMTLCCMKDFSVTVNNQNYKLYTARLGQKYKAVSYTVETDASSAAYFFAIAALTRSKIIVKNLPRNSIQADMRVLTALERIGSTITCQENEITVMGNDIRPIVIDMRDFPDQAQTLAVLLAFAPGISQFLGIRSLRLKETERVKALESELGKMGIRTEADEDTMTIYGGKPKGALISTHGDHRMAMSFAVAGCAIEGISITNPLVVKKTFPAFWETLKEIGISIT